MSNRELYAVNHTETILGLDRIGIDQKTTLDTLGSVHGIVESTRQCIERMGPAVIRSTRDLDALQTGLEVTATDIKQIEKTLSTTSSKIDSLYQSLSAFENNIGASADHNIVDRLMTYWFGVPYPRNLGFVGRDETLMRILKSLEPNSPDRSASVPRKVPRIFGLHGLPGIGKTHVAIEFAYRYQEEFSYIFWIAADSEEKLEQGFVNIARSVGLTSRTAMEDKDKTISLARLWLRGQHASKRTIFGNQC